MDTLARLLGDSERAEILYRIAADAGEASALVKLARMRYEAGDWEQAERIAEKVPAVRGAHTSGLVTLARISYEAGDLEEADRLFRRGVEIGDPDAFILLALMRERAGDREEAERLALRAADAGITLALFAVARARGKRTLWPFGLDPDGTPTRARPDTWLR